VLPDVRAIPQTEMFPYLGIPHVIALRQQFQQSGDWWGDWWDDWWGNIGHGLRGLGLRVNRECYGEECAVSIGLESRFGRTVFLNRTHDLGKVMEEIVTHRNRNDPVVSYIPPFKERKDASDLRDRRLRHVKIAHLFIP